ncbi:MAG: DUF362 domain-containing protein [Candidatus Atabeyarchaeum deiterrae]
MPSKVFYMNDRSTTIPTSLVAKAQTLFDEAGLAECFKKGDNVAVKCHMGEYNNTGYLRPVLVRGIVEKVKEHGGKPFVTDCTCLNYSPFASRTTAAEYRKTAARNGFTAETMDCPLVIADGEYGLDDVHVDLPEGLLLQEQYIGKKIAEADALIVVTHFKGHPQGTVGGSIKNVGVGCASKRGKLNLHMAHHPKYGVNASTFNPGKCKLKKCDKFEICSGCCPVGAIEFTDTEVKWDKEKCVSCFSCIYVAQNCLVWYPPYEYFKGTQVGIADSAAACMKIMKGRVGFINYAIDIAPWCDCVSFSDRAIVPSLGVFASKDIVAIDTACIDMSMNSHGMPGSQAEEKGAMDPGTPKFTICSAPLGEDERNQINAAAKLKMGTQEYQVVEVQPCKDSWRFGIAPTPTGKRLREVYAKYEAVPKGGFKRRESYLEF